MVYANLDIIGEDGQALRDSTWYSNYQQPRGSEHIHFPKDVCMFNVWPNNYVGAAFMYRDRVAYLIGDYSKYRYTTEDYDYWMQVNSLLNLKHSGFSDEIYEYRFHSGSLTSKDRELGITSSRDRLMVFDDFRRDFYISPICWIIRSDNKDDELVKKITSELRGKGQIVISDDVIVMQSWPRYWQTGVFLYIAHDVDEIEVPFDALPDGIFKVVCFSGENSLPEAVQEEWDLCVMIGPACYLPRLSGVYRGWLGVCDTSTLIKLIDVRARTEQLRVIESEIHAPCTSILTASVVVCTYQRADKLRNAIIGVAQQTVSQNKYELIIVNNDPSDKMVENIVAELREKYFSDDSSRLRYLECFIPGLSSARNVGLAEANGEIICFLDDDAVPDAQWLEWIIDSFHKNPEAGVIGGHILLELPDDSPDWLEKVSLSYWSHFQTNHKKYTKVDNWWEFPWGANWCARRNALLLAGGFRTRYGRSGDDYGGGEEIIASALIKKVGYTIGVEPRSVVHHDVGRERYTLEHVKNTLTSGHLVNYQIQRDLYLPMSTSIKSQFSESKDPIKRIIMKVTKFRSEKRGFTYLENMVRLSGKLRVLAAYIKDKTAMAKNSGC
jgi:glycosyltransferase involved in cell wall biosynthesis